MDQTFDVVVIGGGINGCGCAADAALRGLSVLLCEKDDLASKTSSNSSKLIHGGLRYLEHLNFSLVRKALDERQRLLTLAPHLVHPLSFVLPHDPRSRSRWLLACGLFIYDHLSLNNNLPKYQTLNRSKPAHYFSPLQETFKQGFLFYDCKTDDARLVLANALQAKAYGAQIMPHTALTHAKTHKKQWQLTLQPPNAPPFTVNARTVINAAGPWVESVNHTLHIPPHTAITRVQGSHLVVPKLYDGEHAYLLQDDAKRIVFAIPYHNQTLIGTTDTLFTGDPDQVHIQPEEITYLCTVVNRYFNKTLSPADILSTSTGIRTLLAATKKNPTALSRDYAYHFSRHPAPAITIFSGKLTTYRELAESAINTLKPIFSPLPPSKTRTTPLPGAHLEHLSFNDYEPYFRKTYPWLNEITTSRYLATYGTRASLIVSDCKNLADLGKKYGETLYQAEIDYLIHHEWATNTDDILWRRTKLGLTLTESEVAALTTYLKQKEKP